MLDTYYGAFTIEFCELEVYADELLRSNPGSICRDDLKEGRRVFKRMFVCLNAFKK